MEIIGRSEMRYARCAQTSVRDSGLMDLQTRMMDEANKMIEDSAKRLGAAVDDLRSFIVSGTNPRSCLKSNSSADHCREGAGDGRRRRTSKSKRSTSDGQRVRWLGGDVRDTLLYRYA